MSSFAEVEQTTPSAGAGAASPIVAPGQDGSVIMSGGDAEKAADYANYFCSYAYLHHQAQMLKDHVRMHAYHSSVMNNKEEFAGKVVLDVGAGSGILSMWAAQAGAAKVYAVEYTDMAKHARRLVEKNGLGHIVEVLQVSLEDLVLPTKVDIIISEWMGYFLIRESMMDTVIRARDRWLKPEGLMFPSHATMYWGLITHESEREAKRADLMASVEDWNTFKQETQSFYGVDMGALDEDYEREQKEYFVQSACWTELGNENVVSQPVIVKTFDLHTCTLADAAGVDAARFNFMVRETVPVSGFSGWFTVDFKGRNERPMARPITLSTAPDVGYTHWGQQTFYLLDAIECTPGTRIDGSLTMVRSTKNQRLYNCQFNFKTNQEPEQSFVYEMP